jgi:hypothetical protein
MKAKWILITLVLLVNNSRALAEDDYGWSGSELTQAIAAAKDGDVEQIKSFITNKKEPFKPERNYPDSVSVKQICGPASSIHSDGRCAGWRLLNAAVSSDNLFDEDSKCQNEMVNVLLDHGALPDSETLSAAASQPCGEVFDKVFGKTGDEFKARATNQFFTRFKSDVIEGQNSISSNEKALMAVFSNAKKLTEFNKGKCTAENKSSIFCGAVTAAKDLVNRLSEDAAEEKFAS